METQRRSTRRLPFGPFRTLNDEHKSTTSYTRFSACNQRCFFKAGFSPGRTWWDLPGFLLSQCREEKSGCTAPPPPQTSPSPFTSTTLPPPTLCKPNQLAALCLLPVYSRLLTMEGGGPGGPGGGPHHSIKIRLVSSGGLSVTSRL